MLPSSEAQRDRRRSRKKERKRCLFCGDLASETRLMDQLQQLICEKCLSNVGEVFSRRETPLFVESENCISCGCSAAERLLVAGVAASLCRPCYLSAKRGKSVGNVDRSMYPPRGARLRALERSRAARLRDRRESEQWSDTFLSLQPSERRARGPVVLAKQVLADISLESHLELVTSRERIRGRPALKSPDGELPMRRVVTERRRG